MLSLLRWKESGSHGLILTASSFGLQWTTVVGQTLVLPREDFLIWLLAHFVIKQKSQFSLCQTGMVQNLPRIGIAFHCAGLCQQSQAGSTGQSKKCRRGSEKASIQLSLVCPRKSGNIRMIVFLTAQVWISLWCSSQAQMNVACVLLKQKCARSFPGFGSSGLLVTYFFSLKLHRR